MVSKVTLLALAVIFINGVSAYIKCSDPRPFKGSWVIGVDRKECVALVKEKCHGMKRFTTHSWKRGDKVKSNCSKIPKWTAIATFLGSGGAYKGHAAIFDSCAPDGIWVYDQWNAAKVDRRKIRYNGGKPNYNGNNFYTIKL
uniref:U51-Liphistoxin-Lth1a_1 n=1 Tax=Liphistius thaleban TaxID=1905330 RepID=A0A4Q8K402_9ARAC